MHIDRHLIDKDMIGSSYKDYESSEENALRLFETDTTALRIVAGYLFDLFYCSTIAENDVEKRIEWLDLAIEAAVAKYSMAVNIGKSARFEFMNATYELTPPAKDYRISVIDWTRAYMSAIIRRNSEAIDQLAAVDLDTVRQLEKAKGLEYNFLFAQFLQRLFDEGVDHGKTLVKASKASMEVPKSSLVYDFMLDIGGPQIDLFTYILFRDEEKFNDLLRKALLSFKKYYERQGEQGKRDPYGLVSIPLSAIVRLARDRGIAIHHTSDYLPDWLINAG